MGEIFGERPQASSDPYGDSPRDSQLRGLGTESSGTGHEQAAQEIRWSGLGWALATTIWLLILAYVGFSLWQPYAPNEDRDPKADYTVASQEQFLGMVELAMRNVVPEQRQQPQQVDPLDPLIEEPTLYLDRLGRTVVTLEKEGAAKALEQLEQLDALAEREAYEPNEFELRRREVLGRLYRDIEASQFELPSISQEEREDLTKGLGWFGSLAQEPAGTPVPSPRRTELLSRATKLFVVFAVIVFMGLSMLGTGVIAFITSGVLFAFGKLKFRSTEVVSRGTIYLETFAIWLLTFNLVSIVSALLLPKDLLLVAGITGPVVSMGAVFWPMLRGVEWSELKRDIGWHSESWFKEMFLGAWGYTALLPVFVVLVIAWAVTLWLGNLAYEAIVSPEAPALFDSPTAAAHPINEIVERADWFSISMVVLMAVVLAPLVEETFFRGVLYRHLREVSCRWHRFASAAISTLVTAFVFAAIHPQGILLVPPLGILGAMFAILREWRGSIIASMTAHAIHNGWVTTLAVTIALLTK